MVVYWSKNLAKVASSYPPQSHKSPSLGVTPFEFGDEPDICSNYNIIFRLSDGEKIMTLAFFVLNVLKPGRQPAGVWLDADIQTRTYIRQTRFSTSHSFRTQLKHV